MTKRDTQASEYAAEAYGKTYRNRCVSHMRWEIPDRLREASHYALMDAARGLVREAADEIERLRQFDRSQPIAICNTQRPVAWARFWPNGSPQSVYLDRPPADAVPLYRSPTTHTTPNEGTVHGECTLTAEERASIEVAALVFDTAGNDIAPVLRHLLERLPCHT